MAGTEGGGLAAGTVVVTLGAADLPELMRLSISAHWNQNEDDWRHMLSAGRGWGIRLADGLLAASTVVLPYGPFAWISMVLVLPEQRRRGFATRLLALAIESLRQARQVPVLDATPAGHPVYRGLGFTDGWVFTRWQRDADAPAAPAARVVAPSGCEVRPLREADWAELLAQDLEAFGSDRAALLRRLAQRLPAAALVARREGRLAGWLLGRPGRVATQLGPLHAEDPAVACALLDRALLECALLECAPAASHGAVFVDAPQRHAGFADALRARGFLEQRSFTRMALGGPTPGDARRLWLVAGPELG